jgi:two-component system, sensor histidine kinase LadS
MNLGRFKQFVLAGFLMFFHGSVITAQPVMWLNDLSENKLNGYLSYFREEQPLNFSDIVSGKYDSLFVHDSSVQTPNLGFVHGTYWIKFRVQTLHDEKNWLLEFAYPFYDSLFVLVEKPDSGFSFFVAGDHLPFYQRWFNHPNFIFPFHLKASPAYSTVYARLVCHGEATSLPVGILTAAHLAQRDYMVQLSLGAYYGILTFAFFLTLFLVFSLRERAQWFYLAYVLFVALFQGALDGYLFKFVFFDFPYGANHIIPFAGASGIAFLILFTVEVLKIGSHHQRLDFALKTLAGLFLLLALTGLLKNPFYSFALKTTNVLAVLANLLILGTAIFAFYRKLPNSRYFLVAFSFLISGLIVSLLKNVGVLPRFFLTEYAFQMGSAIEVTMLSFLLAQNLRLFKTEKEKMQAQLLDELEEKYRTQQKAKEELEIKVKERTADLEIQKSIVEQKNKDIIDSINYAQRIQYAMMPDEKQLEHIFPDSFLIYLPKDIVCGDFYWFTKKEDEVFIAVADCTGHGVPGALMSMAGTSFLNEIVNEYNIHGTAEILDLLRVKIIRLLHQHENTSKDGMDIALCRINLVKREITYSGAFNPVYLLTQNPRTDLKCLIEQEEGKPALYTTLADRFPVGYIADSKSAQIFTESSFSYSQGDWLYMFTDGFADQFGGPQNKKFKYKNLQELIVKVYQQNKLNQKEQLTKAFYDWMGNEEQVDDTCIMGIRL